MSETSAKTRKPAEKYAPLPALDLSDAAVPDVVTRGPKRPNQFLTVVQSLAENWNESENRSAAAKSLTVPAALEKQVRAEITSAAQTVGRSPRIVSKAGSKAGTVTLTFWLTKKIARPRKNKSETPAAS